MAVSSEHCLTGLRVLQVADSLAAGLAARSLSDLGADVMFVDSSGINPELENALNSGKRSLRGLISQEVVAGADVVIGPEELPDSLRSSLRSDAITVSIPLFPSDDDNRADYPFDENLVLAAAGVLAERGPNNRLRGTRPILPPLSIASAYAAAFGALGCLAALMGRQRHGHGEHVEASYYLALLEGFSYNHFRISDLPTRYTHPQVREAKRAPLPEKDIQDLIDPLYRSYQTADDRWFYIATPAHRGLIERLLKALGLWNRLLEDGLPIGEPYAASDAWSDPEQGSVFAYPALSDSWRRRLRAEVATVIRCEPATHWEAVFSENRLCGTTVLSMSDWCGSAHASLSGLVSNDLRSGHAVPGPFAWEVGQNHSATPPKKESQQWLSEGWESPEKSERHLPLQGIRVADLCNVIAGPTVAGALTRFGAEVTKIDPPTPGFGPFTTGALSLQSGRGKRSALLDIRSEGGRSVFEKLLPDTHLVTFNGPNSQLRALGLRHDDLSVHSPSIVVTQITAFQGPMIGPCSERLGVDEVLQAATGLMERFRPNDAPPEEFAHFGTIDVVTGIWGAVASVAGLLAAQRTGQGRHMATSLAAGAGSIQFPQMCGADTTENGTLDLTPSQGAPLGAYRCGGSVEPLVNYDGLRRSEALPFQTHNDHPSGLEITLIAPCAIRLSKTRLRSPEHPSKYGSDTRAILCDLQLGPDEVEALLSKGIAAESWPHHDQYFPR